MTLLTRRCGNNWDFKIIQDDVNVHTSEQNELMDVQESFSFQNVLIDGT